MEHAAGDPSQIPDPDKVDHFQCLATVHKLYDFLDGELTEERRLEISRHLDECKPCLKAFGFEKDLREMIANRCRDSPPPALKERIAEALRKAASDSTGGSQIAE